ncbi:MAG: DUF2927 domain-containing protein [Albidovulum sp.]
MRISFSTTFRPVLGAIGLAAALAACTTDLLPASTAKPAAPHDTAPFEAPVTAPDRAALEAADYYRRIEANTLSQGLLRLDGGGNDTPFGPRQLSENFLRITFFDEFSESGGKLVAGGREERLHRWQKPVRLALEFDPMIPLAERSADRALVSRYLARLSRITGLSMRLVPANGNFVVMVLNPTERSAARGRILAAAPGTSAAALQSAVAMKPDTYCTVFSYFTGRSTHYDRAVAIIRGELPERMRLNCFHEEIAQGLGLINDSPKARPSIFNDSEEFAALTTQDEMMLRILYDKRLRPGMTLAEARPIVETIAAELLPGDS